MAFKISMLLLLTASLLLLSNNNNNNCYGFTPATTAPGVVGRLSTPTKQAALSLLEISQRRVSSLSAASTDSMVVNGDSTATLSINSSTGTTEKPLNPIVAKLSQVSQ